MSSYYQVRSGERFNPEAGLRRTCSTITIEEEAMKRIGIFLSMLAVASSALAGDGASPGKGKELFTGKKTGDKRKKLQYLPSRREGTFKGRRL